MIADAPPRSTAVAAKPLLDIAVVIRSKDAGINQQTYDVIFRTCDDYEMPLRSNLFHRSSIATILQAPAERVIGTYHVGARKAIKITLERWTISGSADDRDVFGAQQQRALESLSVPVH